MTIFPRVKVVGIDQIEVLVVLPPDVAFKDGAKEALYGKPGMAQTTV